MDTLDIRPVTVGRMYYMIRPITNPAVRDEAYKKTSVHTNLFRQAHNGTFWMVLDDIQRGGR